MGWKVEDLGLVDGVLGWLRVHVPAVGAWGNSCG